jgi:hypothetical protein
LSAVTAKSIIFAAFLFSGLTAGAQPAVVSRNLPKFVGREITITEPERGDYGFPTGPATVCVQGPPQRQCYTAPKDFGNSPTATVVQLKKGLPAIFFSAASGGVSGWMIHFALLRLGTGKDLDDLLLSDADVSNQSQHAFWNEPTVSDARILVTADYIWGPDEAHYAAHRYIVSSYVCKPSSLSGDPRYYIDDRYMTVNKYDLDAGVDILAAEKQEILARLRRAKAAAEAEARQQAPR